MSAVKKTAETSVPIHTLISERWSPRAFANRPVEHEKLRSPVRGGALGGIVLQRAAVVFHRWQRRTTPRIIRRFWTRFVEFNQSWAKGAPVWR